MTEYNAQLSGAGQGNCIKGLAVDALRTTVHQVPDGETHIVRIVYRNIHPSGAVRVVGDLDASAGSGSNQTFVIDANLASRTQEVLLDDMAIDGPCDIKLAAIANETSAIIHGAVKIIRRK